MRIDGQELFSSRGVSDKLKIGRNLMMKRLRERCILKQDNHPMRGYEDCFVVRRSLQFDVATTYWTDRGIRLTSEICADLPKIKIKPLKEMELSDGLIEIINSH